MSRNDTIAHATPLSNISLIASISPFSNPSSAGPDVDVYTMSAVPGSLVLVYAASNKDFLQPPAPNSLLPVVEVVNADGVHYQTCREYNAFPGALYNLPCVNGLGTGFITIADYYFQVPGSGTAPVTFYVLVSDERGDARPDFLYTFGVSGVN